MKIEIFIKILKTLLSKDTDPGELKKPWYWRRRYWGAAIAIGGIGAYYKFGLVLDNDMEDTILDNLEVIKSSIEALISAFTALYGIFLYIKGEIGHRKKLESVCGGNAGVQEGSLPKPAPLPQEESHEKIEEQKSSDG